MRTIIAADIHGVTAPLRSMMTPLAGDAVFVSPWDTSAGPFQNEAEAHSAFISRQGIKSYAEKIAAAAGREPAFIVGFSVGASAAWLHAASGNGNPGSVATLFYGSRIRDYSSLVAKIDITAIFAETESSFSPEQLAEIIAGDRVSVAIEAGTKHGFMNPLSENFAPQQCLLHLQRLRIELARFRARL
jgi:dienelactone hydrolase